MKNLKDYIIESLTIENIEDSKWYRSWSEIDDTKKLFTAVVKTTSLRHLLSTKDRQGKTLSEKDIESQFNKLINRLADSEYEYFGIIKSGKFQPLDADKIKKLYTNPTTIKGCKLYYNEKEDIMGLEYNLKGMFSGKLIVKFHQSASDILANGTEKDLELDMPEVE